MAEDRASAAIIDWCEAHRAERIHPDVQICRNHLHSDAACAFVQMRAFASVAEFDAFHAIDDFWREVDGYVSERTSDDGR